jgi:iron complex outermembrane receptor protein
MHINRSKRNTHSFSLPNSIVLSTFCTIAILIPGHLLFAQDNTASEEYENVLEEITVTSRRYEENLKDAPVSVNVLTQDFINQNRIQRADDILTVTPGATWESFSKMQPVASMRGIIAPTPGNSSSEASIQTVVDNVVITKDFMKSPPLFDMHRIEVLRGPQGTAFGRNASVGLIHFVTQKPSQERAGGVLATAGSDKLWELQGFYNGGMSDTVSGRIAFNYTTFDGETESISTGKGLDGLKNKAIRGSLLIEPSENFSALLKLEYSEDRDDAPVRHGFLQPDGQGCTIPYVRSPPYKETWFDDCNDPFKTEISAEDSETDFHTDRDIWTFAAELVWSLENDLAVTSITGYMDGQTDSLMDLIGTPNDVAFQEVKNDGHSFSQEVRIDNQASGDRWRWLAGLFYMSDEEDRFEENKFQPRNGRSFPFVPTFLATFSNNQTTSWSAFGEISYDISDRSVLTYGGRWITDSKDYTYGVRASGFCGQIAGVEGIGEETPPVCGSPEDPLGFSDYPVDDSWSDYINKLSYSFAINDNMNIYGLYSEGWKSGTFQPDARNKASVDVVVDPETSRNFEIGLKNASARSQYAITAYYLKNKDTQTINLVPVGAGFTGLISNVGAVESLGLEVEGTFLITDNFLLSGNFSLIDAELKDTPDPSDPTVDISGERPPGAPKWTYFFFGEYTWNLSGGSDILFRLDFRGRSNVYNQTSVRDTDPPLRLRPQINDWGARVTWLPESGNWSLALWGKNLSEDWDIENFGPPSPCCSSYAAGFRGKRSYGVTFNYGF